MMIMCSVSLHIRTSLATLCDMHTALHSMLYVPHVPYPVQPYNTQLYSLHTQYSAPNTTRAPTPRFKTDSREITYPTPCKPTSSHTMSAPITVSYAST
jgi:hypothetical protein